MKRIGHSGDSVWDLRIPCALDTDAFHQVIGMTQASRIRDDNRETVNVKRQLEDVSGRPRYGGYNCRFSFG